jgi:hypothetical protein
MSNTGAYRTQNRRAGRPAREVRRTLMAEPPPSREAATPKAAERLSRGEQRTVSTSVAAVVWCTDAQNCHK